MRQVGLRIKEESYEHPLYCETVASCHCKEKSAELLRASGDDVRARRLLCSGVWVLVGIALKGG